MNTSQLLRFGVLAALSFWITNLGCGYVIDYNHLTGSVSEIGAVGTPTQSPYTGGIMLCAVFNALFVLGLFKVCMELGISRVPVYILAAFSVSMFGVSLFPAPQLLHGVFGVISMLMHIAPLLAFIMWKGDNKFRSIRRVSLAAFFLMAVSITSFFPLLQTEVPGLVVRFFHIGWSAWYVFMSFYFIQLIETKVESKGLEAQLF